MRCCQYGYKYQCKKSIILVPNTYTLKVFFMVYIYYCLYLIPKYKVGRYVVNLKQFLLH